MSANGFASRSRPFRPGIHPAYLLACRVTSKTYPEAKCGQQQRILRILGLRSQSWGGGSDLVSCIPSPAGDSTGRGRMDSEMAGNPGQFVCTGPAGLDDRVVSGGSLFGNLRHVSGRSGLLRKLPADRSVVELGEHGFNERFASRKSSSGRLAERIGGIDPGGSGDKPREGAPRRDRAWFGTGAVPHRRPATPAPPCPSLRDSCSTAKPRKCRSCRPAPGY